MQTDTRADRQSARKVNSRTVCRFECFCLWHIRNVLMGVRQTRKQTRRIRNVLMGVGQAVQTANEINTNCLPHAPNLLLRAMSVWTLRFNIDFRLYFCFWFFFSFLPLLALFLPPIISQHIFLLNSVAVYLRSSRLRDARGRWQNRS